MTPYFVIYGFVMAGVALCFLRDEETRGMAQTIFFSLLLFVLAAFAGMRSPEVDRDFHEYVLWFDLLRSGDAPLVAWLRDPAFGSIAWIVAKAGLSYSVVAFIYAVMGLLATWSFALAVSSRRWVTLFFYLLFCQYFIVLEMTEIRAAVAIPLMGLSLYLACKNQRRRAVWTYLLALVFHFSVIIALPFLVLVLTGARFRTRAWLYSLVALGAVASVTMRSLIDLLSGLYRISEFLNGGAEENDLRVISWYALAHLLVVAVPALLIWKKLSLHERLATLACSLGLTLFLVFGWNTGLATRFLYIFDLYWLLILIMLLDKFQPETKVFYVAFLILAGFALYYKSLQYVQPYSTLRDWDAMLQSAPFGLPLLR